MLRRNQIIGGALALALIVVVGIQVLGLDQLGDEKFRYSFQLDLTVKAESVHLGAVFQCQRYELSTGTPGQSEPRYAVSGKSLGKRLADGRGLFVAVPDVCSFLQDSEGRHINGKPLRRQWPSIQEPRNVVPLIYLTDSFDNPRAVTMFANPTGSAGVSEIAAMNASVRQVRASEVVESPESEATKHDPFNPDRGRNAHWVGLAFLPTFLPVAPQSTWFAETIKEGACQVSLVNRTGKVAVSTIDPYAEYLGEYWPRLWQSIAPSEIVTASIFDQAQLTSIEQGLVSVIPVKYSDQGIKTLDLTARGEILLYPESEFIKGMHDFTQYRIGQNGFTSRPSDIKLPPGNLPIIAECDGRVYRPVVLTFAFDALG